jgi:hypothetical protein
MVFFIKGSRQEDPSPQGLVNALPFCNGAASNIPAHNFPEFFPTPDHHPRAVLLSYFKHELTSTPRRILWPEQERPPERAKAREEARRTQDAKDKRLYSATRR